MCVSITMDEDRNANFPANESIWKIDLRRSGWSLVLYDLGRG